jgi:RNA polymerase sigma factor (sigma-70 family)
MPLRAAGFKPAVSDQFHHPGPVLRERTPAVPTLRDCATSRAPVGFIDSGHGKARSRVEVSALKLHGAAGLRGPTPLLRLQGDERLVALTRRGNQVAYEALVARYQARLLAFCRHMLSSREDAEDVLQEVFAAAFNAMLADDRPINVRPWLYRIARNRCLNHLRKQTAIGVDSMDVHLAENGTTTADKVHDREDFRELVADVQTLAETQRTALLLREIDALSYEQIAEAMETTVPSVKSLLVRARVSLAEAAEARKLTCAEVRDELGAWAEGLTSIGAPVRRHVRSCQRCSAFKKQLKQTNKALAAVFPVGPLLLFKKFLLAQGAGGAAAGGAAATGGVAAGGMTTGSALSAGVGAVATKAAAGLAAVAIVTTGAVEVDHAKHHRLQRDRTSAVAMAAAPKRVAAPVQAPPAPRAVSSAPQASPKHPSAAADEAKAHERRAAADTGATTTVPAGSTAVTEPASATVPSSAAPGGTQTGYDDTRLPGQPVVMATAPSAPMTAVTPAPPTAAAEPQPTAPSAAPTSTAPAPEPEQSTTTPPPTRSDPVPADPAPPADDGTTTTPASSAAPPAGGDESPASSTVPAG